MDAAVDTSVYIPVCLPLPEAEYEGKIGKSYLTFIIFQNYLLCPALVTGWGTLSEGGRQSSVLQEVELGVVSDKNCSVAMTEAFGQKWKPYPGEQLCAGGEAGKDACKVS